MAMTAALIATRQMKALDLATKAAEKSALFAEGLAAIDSPLVKGFRCIGLMIGIDLPSAEAVGAVQESMKAQGVHGSLSTGATLRWMPPLVITRAEIETVLQAFAHALEMLE
jgi:acetylornithine/succinyldiaminopimelate/putrescine aminotransferase